MVNKSINLDELQSEVEKLLALLKDRQLDYIGWNLFMTERLMNLAKIIKPFEKAIQEEQTQKELDSDFIWAAYSGNLTEVSKLLAAGAHVDARDSSGKTALMCACPLLKMVELLVEAGADVNAKDDEGTSCIEYARRTEKVVNYLRKHGATR